MTNNYKPISNATVTTSTTCGNFSQSGTISVSNVVGGTAPYTYSFIKSNNPAYDDALSNYQSSPTFTANEYGTYQIRVKDACGNFFTVTREVVSTKPPARIEFATEKTAYNTTTFTYLRVRNANTGAILTGDFKTLYPNGIKLVIRQNDPNGKIVFDGIYTRQPI